MILGTVQAGKVQCYLCDYETIRKTEEAAEKALKHHLVNIHSRFMVSVEEKTKLKYYHGVRWPNEIV